VKSESDECQLTAKELLRAEEQYKALKCKADLEEVRADYIASPHSPSRLQRDVALILSEMDIGFVEEYVDQRSMYSLDMLLSDKRTAIEVDGPSHYATGTHRPLGNTNMKHRHLTQLGFDLRVLPYWYVLLLNFFPCILENPVYMQKSQTHIKEPYIHLKEPSGHL